MSQHDPDQPEHNSDHPADRPAEQVAGEPEAETREHPTVPSSAGGTDRAASYDTVSDAHGDWTQVTREQPVVPPQAPGPWGYPAPAPAPVPQQLTARHAAPSARVAGWVWPLVAMLALVVGVVGVIGPTRLNYARVIPMVDFTAQTLSRLMR